MRHASICEGKPYQAYVIFYAPTNGFKGTDSFTIERSVFLGRSEYLDNTVVEIEVQ